MKNTIPYLILITLLLSKVFAWWMILFGSNILEVEATLSNLFQPLHQFSYLALSSVLVVGIVFRSKFAFTALLLTVPANLIIYLYHGTSVYQSLWDPMFLLVFGIVATYRKPNHWGALFRANTTLKVEPR